MTSQVAVLNLSGIAVASDTVVTITRNSAKKTMGNTAKIYELGSAHKVLVLHSGSTELNSVPVSLFVSEWSKTIPTPLATLQDYVEAFTKWASREAIIHSRDSEIDVMSTALREHFGWISRNAKNSLASIVREENETDEEFEERCNSVVSEAVEGGASYLNNLPSLKSLTEYTLQAALDSSGYDLDEWVSSYFEQVPLSQANIESMKAQAVKCLQKFQELDSDGTLAFIGYGSEEPFGGSIKVTVRGIYANGLRCTIEDRFGVAADDKTGIHSFAQGDAIHTFLRGYHQKIFTKFKELYSQAIFEQEDCNVLQENWQAIEDQIITNLKDYSHEQFVSPMLDTIDAMSLQSLAEFAESLVGLQATATYADSGPATVGGLVEVATIDRTHGVQWVKSLESRRQRA